ncbi:HAD family hydrolase [Parabacteroides sp. PF5-6]|uniref:HAD family hydrolase n=1 Tax=Parabacteroides sp. PF5-6 TaxID=1742403 RepID=UPI0024051484|nr:HAD family hydrolase [Parabacteroides sp. PF5-6]MDF9829237.1 phosphoglycolate phosphatase [Parabacteroides sp. PF5-6]
MIKLVIFDLDGTLLNTIADLAESTNYALAQHGFPTHPTTAYNFFVGNGINKLFERALPEGEKTEENILRIRQSFLNYYSQHNRDRSTPYAGIPELLKALQQKGIRLAVASNKYHEATRELIAHYFPETSFVEVLGQREGIAPKPDPTIVFDILATAGVQAEETLFVGDSGVDMQTAKNAKVCACGVTWGFRPRHELEGFQPEFIVEEAAEIRGIVGE